MFCFFFCRFFQVFKFIEDFFLFRRCKLIFLVLIVEIIFYVSENIAVWESRKRRKTNAKLSTIYFCPTPGCNQGFHWRSNLYRHLKNTCGGGLAPDRYKCPYCVYSCKVKVDIRVHIARIHKNKKVYVVELTSGDK